MIPSPSPNHKYPKHLLHIFFTSKRIQYAKAPHFHIPKTTTHKYNTKFSYIYPLWSPKHENPKAEMSKTLDSLVHHQTSNFRNQKAQSTY